MEEFMEAMGWGRKPPKSSLVGGGAGKRKVGKVEV